MGLYDANEFEKATVARFFADSDRRYGFARFESGGPDLYFQAHTGKRPEPRGGPDDIELRGKMPRIPRSDDRIVVRRGEGNKGPRALEWMFENELLLVQRGLKLQFTFDEAEFHLGGLRRSTTEDRQYGNLEIEWVEDDCIRAVGHIAPGDLEVVVKEYGLRAQTRFCGRAAGLLRLAGHAGDYKRLGSTKFD